MAAEKTSKEEFTVSGDKLIEKIKQIIKEGNIRKITIKDKNDKIIAEFPLAFGIVGVVVAPVWAAIGAIAALVTECKITIERQIEK